MEGRRLWGVFAFLCVFFLVHIAKMSRMYLVLLEQKIPFRRLLWTYLKTTFVNLVIPFKMGECYRIYCYAKDTKVFQIGLFSVIDFLIQWDFSYCLYPLSCFLQGRLLGLQAFSLLFSYFLYLYTEFFYLLIYI